MAERLGLPTVGDVLGPLTIPVSAERVLAYAEASGDHNPLHLDPAFAATTEFGGPIAHGMLLLAYLSRLMGDRFGPAWATSGVLEARFRAPALVGQAVIARGVVGQVLASDGGALVECTLSCTDAAGMPLLTATARLDIAAGVAP